MLPFNQKLSCPLYDNFLKQPHLLIAGATGSGKSVLINDFISYILKVKTPEQARLILIDPKKVELYKYISCPHALKYASENKDIIKVLDLLIDEMMKRYTVLQRQNKVSWQGTHLYIFIDELADLLTTEKKAVLPKLQRLAQLGRASGIHLIMATQRPTKDILSGQLKVNLDSRVALRVATPQDSRNIIDISGAEQLPRYGQALYKSPEYLVPILLNIEYSSPEQIQCVINAVNNYYNMGIIKSYMHKSSVLDCSKL